MKVSQLFFTVASSSNENCATKMPPINNETCSSQGEPPLDSASEQNELSDNVEAKQSLSSENTKENGNFGYFKYHN